MKLRRIVGLGVLALVALPGAGAAQDWSTSLDELKRAGTLRPGDRVHVTDANGRRLSGRITDLSTGLTVADGRDTWTLPDAEVSQIDLEDSVKNGVWLGFAAGAGAHLVICLTEFNAFLCPQGSDSLVAAFMRPFIKGLPYAALGALTGGLIDARTHTTLYKAPGSARVAVSPILARERLGARMSVTW